MKSPIVFTKLGTVSLGETVFHPESDGENVANHDKTKISKLPALQKSTEDSKID